MANLQSLLQAISGANQNNDPLAELLQSRGAPVAPFSSGIVPQEFPNLIQSEAQTQDQSSDFYGMLNAISDRINTNRQAAEDTIARNAQKAHDDALMRKIRSLIPQSVPSFSGSSGSVPRLAPPPLLNPSSGSHHSSGSIFPKLPEIKPNKPVVAPPPCPQHLVDLGLC